MKVLLNYRAAVAGALTMLVFSACSGKSDDGEDGLLRFVPADTPYVFASGEPLDEEFLDAIEPYVDRILAAYRDLLTAAAAEPAADAEADGQAVGSFVTELSPLFSIDALEKAGIARDAEFVLYGNGLLPVLRVAISDPAAFEKTIAGLEDAAGEALQMVKLGDGYYRYAEGDGIRIVLGHFDETAVLTMMPAEFDEAQTRELLGLNPPAKSLAATTIIPDIRKKYGFSAHYVGYVDTQRLVDIFLDDPTTLNAALLQKAEFDFGSISESCKSEIREMAAIAPRALFGYGEISLEQISGKVVVELRDDLAKGLQGVSAAVPGLGVDQGGVLTVGASVNMQALRDFYAKRLDAIEADPYQCEYFAELQASVPKGREMLNQPLPPVVYGVRGFNAVVDTLDIAALTAGAPPEPGKVEATVVVAMQDAASLVAMGMMFSPELAALNLQPNGEAVALALPQLEAMAVNAFAAMKEDALSVAVGPAAQARVTSVLGAESLTPPPSFAMSMDAGAYYDFIATGMMVEEPAEQEPMTPEMKTATQTVLTALGDLYDRISTVVRFTENGAEVDSVVTLKDL
jgi:hypothetical protein